MYSKESDHSVEEKETLLLEEWLEKMGIFMLEKNTPVGDDKCLHILEDSDLSL